MNGLKAVFTAFERYPKDVTAAGVGARHYGRRVRTSPGITAVFAVLRGLIRRLPLQPALHARVI
jgi:hypothetical protein